MTGRSGWQSGLVCIALVVLSGCLSTKPPVAPADEQLRARNNAASLLHSLLGDEKNVSKLLIIKRDREELHRVIKHVASVCKDAHRALGRLAAGDSSLDLRDTALPVGETIARASAAKKNASELLEASGDEFEFKLLLTQMEALGYATHLAQVAGANEPHPPRARVFFAIRDQMEQLRNEIVALLKSQRPPPVQK